MKRSRVAFLALTLAAGAVAGALATPALASNADKRIMIDIDFPDLNKDPVFSPHTGGPSDIYVSKGGGINITNVNTVKVKTLQIDFKINNVPGHTIEFEP